MGITVLFAGFCVVSLAGKILSAAGITNTVLGFGTGLQIGTADAFVMIRRVIGTDFVGCLLGGTSGIARGSIFVTGTGIVALTRRIFSTAGLADTVIRNVAGLQIGLADAFLEDVLVIRAAVRRLLHGRAGGLGVSFFGAALVIIKGVIRFVSAVISRAAGRSMPAVFGIGTRVETVPRTRPRIGNEADRGR